MSVCIQVEYSGDTYGIPGSAERESWESIEADLRVVDTDTLEGWGAWVGCEGVYFVAPEHDYLVDVYTREPGVGWVRSGIWGGEHARHLTVEQAEEACATLAREYPDADWGYAEGPEFPVTCKYEPRRGGGEPTGTIYI
jgi:hypothetical protein